MLRKGWKNPPRSPPSSELLSINRIQLTLRIEHSLTKKIDETNKKVKKWHSYNITSRLLFQDILCENYKYRCTMISPWLLKTIKGLWPIKNIWNMTHNNDLMLIFFLSEKIRQDSIKVILFSILLTGLLFLATGNIFKSSLISCKSSEFRVHWNWTE